MKQPEKWKETVDPFLIPFRNFKLLRVLGYPHARNDVFYANGLINQENFSCFIKYASKPDSNIINEAKAISALDFDFLPKILEYDTDGHYIVTKEIDGERLSYILQTTNHNSMDYMFEYGKTLAQIHSVKYITPQVMHRKFFDIPNKSYFKENNIEFMFDYLTSNKPNEVNSCFCHGDFHYANILWKNKKLVGVLDWELSGIGNKEFDIAWAIINRPSQKFLRTEEEVNKFLEGYKSVNTCNVEYVKYYMLLIYSHFISVDKENEEYVNFVHDYMLNETKKELTV